MLQIEVDVVAEAGTVVMGAAADHIAVGSHHGLDAEVDSADFADSVGVAGVGNNVLDVVVDLADSTGLAAGTAHCFAIALNVGSGLAVEIGGAAADIEVADTAEAAADIAGSEKTDVASGQP